MFERYAFVAITTSHLGRAKAFWVDLLGCRVTEEQPDHHFIVDAGGLRLCVDAEDGRAHIVGGTDPTIGLKVASVRATLDALRRRGFDQTAEVVQAARGAYALIRDPDGHTLVLTEMD